MKIAIEGCCHGELDKIYDTVIALQNQGDFKIDLLIICGDFQAVRNFDDLQAMAVPQKYQQLNTFYKYYNREKVAPVLTVFIGGNHEASNYMQELPYGGWVAPNIYYLGYAGIIQVGGVRIGGISGIYKGHDYTKGHFERPPYERDTIRSVYHVRNLEVFRLKQISRDMDIFVSHDWPRGIYHNGDMGALLKKKPFFKQEIEENTLGAKPLADLLGHLQPSYWFAAHLHVKFAAHVEHKPADRGEPAKSTKFLSLDKCLPHRQFLQVLDVPHDPQEGLKIKLDPEWLTILRTTDHLLKLTPGTVYMPGPGGRERYDFKVSEEEIRSTVETFGGDMTLPENFVQTSPPIFGQPTQQMKHARRRPLTVQVNPQTTLLCTMLDITDPNAKILGKTSQQILDERSISPAGSAGSVGGGSDDAGESDKEMPSTIDSSMDVSSLSSLADQSGWESFHTARESFSDSRLNSSSFTPFKGVTVGGATRGSPLVLPAPKVVPVTDDDEELLSILSAQKSRSTTAKESMTTSTPGSNKAAPLVLPAPSSEVTPVNTESSVSASTPADNAAQDPQENEPSLSSQTPTSSDQCERSEKSRQEPVSNLADTSSPTSSSNTSPHLPRLLSSSSQGSPCDSSRPSLKPERSSLGMSGLQLTSDLSSSSSSVSPTSTSGGVKRASPEAGSVVSSPAATSSEISPSVKKLKRRNVSVYTEPTEG